jgi:hypothetical protein
MCSGKFQIASVEVDNDDDNNTEKDSLGDGDCDIQGGGRNDASGKAENISSPR